MGGVGKTRLAIQVAQEVAATFPAGVWFVDLSSLSDPQAVPQSIATVLGVREQPGKTLLTSLGDYLQQKRLLLVLDNCEHLLSASAAVVDALLQRCASLQVFATSRQPLGLTGEATWLVPSLTLPEAASPSVYSNCISSDDPGANSRTDLNGDSNEDLKEEDLKKRDVVSKMLKFEAIQLFVERARLALPTFQLHPQNVRAVAEVCVRVDGVPFALELAAARVRALSVEQIAARLEDRFHLLTGGSRSALPRQQTLRASIDWSYDLLPAKEQRLLWRLAAFSGGWTLEGAEEVCAGEPIGVYEVMDLLANLVDKSLIVVAAEETGVARYRLLETVRHYALDRLQESGEAEEIRRRHCACFLALAQEAAGQLHGPEHPYWANRLETEVDNLRSALKWCLGATGEQLSALQLAGALCRFWDIQGYLNEGRAFLQAALTAPDALNPNASAPNEFERIANADPAYAAARAGALQGAGKLAWRQNDVEAAIIYFEECLRLYDILNYPNYRAYTLLWLGNAAFRQQRYDRAQELFARTLTLAQELKNDSLVAWAFLWLGNVAHDYASAHAYYLQSLNLATQIDLKDCVAYCLCNLGSQAVQQRDYDGAQTLLRDGLQRWRALRNKPETVHAVTMLALLAAYSGQERRATLLLAATDTLRKEMGIPVAANKQQEYTERLSAMQTLLTEETFRVIWAQGQTLSFDQTVEMALQES